MSGLSVRHTLNRGREAGLVSIMVTLILMIVISLIVLGFAQISRRNQRQALDRQLSTQAFYAAESGVNDARDIINAAVQSGTAVVAKSDCGPHASYGTLRPDLDGTGTKDAEYTCVLVNPTPDTLLYSEVSTPSTIIPVISASGANINRVTLTWKTKDANNNTPTANCPNSTTRIFSPTNSWNCGYGVLRVDLVRTNGTFNYADLQSRTMTTFLVPLGVGGATSLPYAPLSPNFLYGVDCSDANCTFSFDISAPYLANHYYLRVSSIYKPVSLQVNAYDAANNLLGLRDAQAIIDATGRAQDVLRRIQVHMPLTASSQNLLSDYAMQSTDAICKRFIAMTNLFDTQVSGVTSTNPLCQP